MPNIHIIARKNGVGIDRDVELMQSVMRELGEVDWRSNKKPEPIFSQLQALFAKQDKPRLFLLAERVPRLWGRLPGIVALVPNQERFPRRHLKRLRNVDHVLCKTHHAESIFKDHAKSAQYIGFTSEDRKLNAVTPDYNKFFHLAGKSTLKGTETLIDVWSRHPEWPELTIIQAAANAPQVVPNNVNLVTDYVEDETLQRMQNEHGVHLCPSLSEGWGHYIVEAMSCSAVVVTTDGPPMNELVSPERGVVVPWCKSEPRHLGTNWHVDPQSLEKAIQGILDMPTEQKLKLGSSARRWYEANDLDFQERFKQVAAEMLGIAAQPRVSSRVA